MALGKRTVAMVPGKLDTKTGQRAKQLGQFNLLENGFMQKTGEIKKRNGTTSITNNLLGGGTLNSASRLFAYGNELTVRNDFDFYGLSEVLGQWQPKLVTTPFEKTASTYSTTSQDVANDQNGVMNSADVYSPVGAAGLQDITVHAYAKFTVAGGATPVIHVQIVDNKSGQLIDSIIIENGSEVRLTGQTDGVLVTWQRISGGAYDIRGFRITLPYTALSLMAAPVTLASVVGGSMNPYDVVAATGKYIIAFSDSVAVNIGLRRYSSTLALELSNTIAYPGDVAMGYLLHDYLDGNIILGIASTGGSGIRIQTIGVGLLTVSLDELVAALPGGGATVLHMTGYRADAINRVLYDTTGAAIGNNLLFSGVAGAATVLRWSMSLASRAVKIGLNHFFWASTRLTTTPETTALQDSAFLILTRHLKIAGGSAVPDLFAVHAKAMEGYMRPTFTRTLSNVTEMTSAGSGRYVSDFQKNLSSQGNTGVRNVQLDTSGSGTMPDVLVSRSALMTGGPALSYDGSRLTEAGFFWFPDGVTTAGVAGGFLESLQRYEYSLIWVSVDAQGLIHRSAPSIPVSHTLAAGHNSIVLQWRPLSLTHRGAGTSPGVTVEVYRAKRTGGTGADGTFRRVASLANADNTIGGFTDSVADADILANQILYTTGGELPADAVPAAKFITVANNRVFLAGLDDKNQLAFSKTFNADPPIAPEFPGVFRIQMNEQDGGITGLANIDEKLVIFKANSIYILVGDGPSNTFRGTYDNPTQVVGDIGCINPRSIVATPDGVMFQSNKGYYLLNRGLQATYIGAEVESLVETAVDAIHVETANQVRFPNVNGNTLVYDYFFKSWFVFKPLVAKFGTFWKGVAVHLTPSNTLVKENVGNFTDGGAFVAVALETSEISFAQIAGYQRLFEINLVGRASQHILRATLYYNDTGFTPETVNVDTSLLTFTTIDLPYRFRIKPKVQKCDSIKLRVEILSPGGDNINRDFFLTGITFSVGVKEGLAALRSDRYMT